MGKGLREFLFGTRLGDRVLRATERATGLAVVDLAEVEGERYGVTPAGRAALDAARGKGSPKAGR